MIVRPDPASDNPLWTYFCQNNKNVIHKWHHYFDIYHNHFQRYRNQPVKILEIGVFQGGSLQMWKNYFGSNAIVYGVDIDQECKKFEEENIKIFIGDQADRSFLRALREQIGIVDILIDDGGHKMDQQIHTFEELYPAVHENGIYLIEDLHTSYWQEYGGGFKNRESFIEYSKHFIDKLNAWHSHSPELEPDALTKSATGLHIYDSVLVIEKYPNPNKPKVSMTGQGIKEEHQSLRLDTSLQQSQTKTLENKQSDQYASDLYLDLMQKCLTDLIYAQDTEKFNLQGQPFEEYRRVDGMEWPLRAHTMIGLHRLKNLKYCIEDVIAKNIAGDFIETGVWRGGGTIFMRAVLKAHNVKDRNVWVADSFEGLPKPDNDHYPADAGDNHHQFKELAVSLEQVKSNFEKYGLLDDQVKFLKGWFKDTLPTAPIGSLAVVRLDGDMYGSTMEAISVLYPKLSIGGYLIVDDYGAVEGCKQAIHDYRKNHNIIDEIITVDWTGAYWRKSA
jgi:hypothetical protein